MLCITTRLFINVHNKEKLKFFLKKRRLQCKKLFVFNAYSHSKVYRHAGLHTRLNKSSLFIVTNLERTVGLSNNRWSGNVINKTGNLN